MHWIPFEEGLVGLTKRYTAHKQISPTDSDVTALPPAGVLQSSCSVGPSLWVDFLASSAPLSMLVAIPQLGLWKQLRTRLASTVLPPPALRCSSRHAATTQATIAAVADWQSLSHVAQDAGTLAAAAADAAVLPGRGRGNGP